MQPYLCLISGGAQYSTHFPSKMSIFKILEPVKEKHDVLMFQPSSNLSSKDGNPRKGLVSFAVQATIICYGQTGTGKTHTFNACWKRIGQDLAGNTISVTFFEIHGKKCCFPIAPKEGSKIIFALFLFFLLLLWSMLWLVLAVFTTW